MSVFVCVRVLVLVLGLDPDLLPSRIWWRCRWGGTADGFASDIPSLRGFPDEIPTKKHEADGSSV